MSYVVSLLSLLKRMHVFSGDLLHHPATTPCHHRACHACLHKHCFKSKTPLCPCCATPISSLTIKPSPHWKTLIQAFQSLELAYQQNILEKVKKEEIEEIEEKVEIEEKEEKKEEKEEKQVEKQVEKEVEKEEKETTMIEVESFETADEATLSQVAFLDRLEQVFCTQQDMVCTPTDHVKVILMDHVTEHQVNLIYKWKPLSISIMT